MGVIRGVLGAALARLARGAPARVFVVEGSNPPASLPFLRLQHAVELVDTPRSATVLLVAGTLPEQLREAARALHDQMPLPRMTVHWREEKPAHGTTSMQPVPQRGVTGEASVVAEELRSLQAQLLAGALPAETDHLPDVEPAEWRGVGQYGQGGTGMTGGVPYGRPMAATASDRDGLKLDQLSVRIGPFCAPLPTGLTLSLKLQGDVIQEVALERNPFVFEARDASRNIFRRALRQRVRIADVELARARHHLLWLASFLRTQGVRALAMRALALAQRLSVGDAGSIASFRRLLGRTHALDATKHGGVLPLEAVSGRGLGPVERASGSAADERTNDEAYRSLGFEVISHPKGDVHARWTQRLAEAEQGISLAARAGDAVTGGTRRVESPRGLLASTTAPLPSLLDLLTASLPGMEWGDAIALIGSLDIDLRDDVRAESATPLHGSAA